MKPLPGSAFVATTVYSKASIVETRRLGTRTSIPTVDAPGMGDGAFEQYLDRDPDLGTFDWLFYQVGPDVRWIQIGFITKGGAPAPDSTELRNMMRVLVSRQ